VKLNKKIGSYSMKKYAVGIIATICFVVLVSGCTNTLPTTLTLNNASVTGANLDTINITGKTDPNATVEMNGEIVAVDAAGNFYKVITIVTGINNITITAKAPDKSKVSTNAIVTKTVTNNLTRWSYTWNGQLTVVS
jgi:hypothetical protein